MHVPKLQTAAAFRWPNTVSARAGVKKLSNLPILLFCPPRFLTWRKNSGKFFMIFFYDFSLLRTLLNSDFPGQALT